MFGLFKKKLPSCDTLYQDYLSPWFPDGEYTKMTRPDMYILAGYAGKPMDIDEIQPLPADLLRQAKQQITFITKAALQDYQSILLADYLHYELLASVDQYYNRKIISKLIKESAPEQYGNLYLNSVCKLGAILGQLFLVLEGFGLRYSYPYFHSIIVHQETGFGIPVFDWAVKKLSEYGVEDDLVAKFHSAQEAILKYQHVGILEYQKDQ